MTKQYFSLCDSYVSGLDSGLADVDGKYFSHGEGWCGWLD